MTARRREPEAVLCADGVVLVKHTTDVDLARRLALDALVADDAVPAELRGEYNLGRVRVGHIRIVGCLPNSYGAGEGWGWQYLYAAGPARGAFPAVEFAP